MYLILIQRTRVFLVQYRRFRRMIFTIDELMPKGLVKGSSTIENARNDIT